MTLYESLIQPAELSDHKLDRPAVADDVMHDHNQDVFVFCHRDQLRSDQRPSRQIESTPRFVFQDCLQVLLSLCLIRLPQVYADQLHSTSLINVLSRLSILGWKRGSQHFVAAYDLVETTM